MHPKKQERNAEKPVIDSEAFALPCQAQAEKQRCYRRQDRNNNDGLFAIVRQHSALRTVGMGDNELKQDGRIRLPKSKEFQLLYSGLLIESY